MTIFSRWAVCATVLTLLCGPVAAETNLLSNGGFEEPLEPAWEKRTPDDALRKLYRAEGAGRTGAAAVLENLSPAYTRLRQGHGRNIAVAPGSLIELSAWVKSEQGPEGVAMLQLYCIGQSLEILSQPTSVPAPGPFDWTRHSVRAIVPDGTSYVMAYLQTDKGTGRVWFDDAELAVKRPPPAPPPPAPRIALLTDLPDDNVTLRMARVLFEDGLVRVDPEQAGALDGAAGALALYTGTVSSAVWPALEAYAGAGGRVFMDIRAFARCHGREAASVNVGVVGESHPLAARMQSGLRVVREADATAGFGVGQIMPRAGWPDGNLLVLPEGFALAGLETLAEGPGGEPGLVRLPVGGGSVTACDLLSLREAYWRNVDSVYVFTPVSGALGNPARLGQYYAERMSYTNVVAEMRRLADSYPAISMEDEGEASGGDRLWSLNLGEPGKPLYFLYAAAHGNEWEQGYGLMTFARLIAEGKLQDAVDLAKVRIKIIPLLNPDGYARMRRQNANGVDLNRQGDYLWESFKGGDSNGDGVYGPNDYDWKGTAPLSEPEALIYKRIAARPELHGVLDFHGNTGAAANRHGVIAVTGHADNEIMNLDLMRIANARLRGRHLLRQSDETFPTQYLLDRMVMSSGTPFLMNTSARGRFGVLVELPAQYASSYATLMQTDVTCEICRALFLACPPPEAEPPPVARGSVLDLRRLVRQTPGLIHHYTFEGPQADSQNLRLLDRAGAADLQERARGAGTPPLTCGPGYDALSVAGRAVYVTNTFGAGAGWTTVNPIALPPCLTVECVVSPRAIPSPNGGAILAARESDARRGYFLWLTPDGRFETRVGDAAARTVVGAVQTGHWYYVATTYSVSNGQTTINGYCADLTAEEPLQQTIQNATDNGHYGDQAVLGVGCLHNVSGNIEYAAPCAVDEVALFGGAHSFQMLRKRCEALRLPTPAVAYRELFPNDTFAAARPFPREGWRAHRGPGAVHTTDVVVEEFNTAFDENLSAAASFPGDAGAAEGYLNNHAGATDTNYLYWTEEMADPPDVGWLRLVTLDVRSNDARTLRVAFRVDVDGTPENAGDDPWFAGADFLNAPGTGALAVPASSAAWRRHGIDVCGSEWVSLRFVPGSALALGETAVSLPARGRVSGFGLFQDKHTRTSNMRIDNVALYALRVPRQAKRTLLSLQ